MQPYKVRFTPYQLQRLQREATQEGKSVSEINRKAVNKYYKLTTSDKIDWTKVQMPTDKEFRELEKKMMRTVYKPFNQLEQVREFIFISYYAHGEKIRMPKIKEVINIKLNWFVTTRKLTREDKIIMKEIINLNEPENVRTMIQNNLYQYEYIQERKMLRLMKAKHRFDVKKDYVDGKANEPRQQIEGKA